MANKSKRRRKELAEKLGVPRRTAANIIKARGPHNPAASTPAPTSLGRGTSSASPSYTLTDVYLASSKAVGNWFDLGAIGPTDERLVVAKALQGISANLQWFGAAAARMSAGERITARARLMGQIIGAKTRHPNFENLFDELRAEHNRHCPVEARVRVLRPDVS